MGINVPLDPAISCLRFCMTNKFAKERVCVSPEYICILCSNFFVVATTLKTASMDVNERPVVIA